MSDEQVFGFGPFTVLPRQQELMRGDEPVPIGSRAFDLLLALVQADGALVTKQQLFDRIWPGTIVEESNLTVTVSSLRKALGCGVDGARYIATIPSRGYRLVVPVERSCSAVEPPSPGPPATSNLPRLLTRLIGREAEIDRLSALLAEGGLVTVVGTGGVGKTRLALALGAALLPGFPDGVWQVELAPLAAPELIGEAIAARLGLSGPGDRPVTTMLLTYLKPRHLLLILDNCEHLVAEAARVAQAILEGCPGVAILATSREPLNIPGEHVFPLAPLAVPEPGLVPSAAAAMGYSAVRLFVDRAGLLLDGFALDDATAPAAAEICRRLDGIALAIELAVPRLRALGLPQLLAGLEDRFRFLAAGSRTAQPRQQTLKATVEWSYGLLSEAERVLLRRLAVFGGSFSLEAAEAVTAEPPLQAAEVVTHLAGLVDKSLVVALPGSAGSRRYRLLETIRAFAREHLAQAGESHLDRRLASWLVERFAEAETCWPTMPTEPWLARYEPDLDNLRCGLDWAFGPAGDAALGVTLVGSINEFLLDLSLMPERRRWIEIADARLAPAMSDAMAGRIKLALAYTGAYGLRRNLDAARQAVEALRRAGDPIPLGMALRLLASVLARPGEIEEAECHLDEAEALLRPLGVTKPLAALLDTRSSVRFFADDRAGCRAYAEESLKLARALGLRRGIQATSMNLAEHDYADGLVEQAIARGREAAAACRRSGNLITLKYALANLTAYLLGAGDVAGGRAVGREAIQLSRALGDELMTATCIEHMALAAALSGDLARSARLAGYGDAYYRSIGQPRQVTEQITWRKLAALLEEGLDPTGCRALMEEGGQWREETAVDAALADGRAGPRGDV